MTRNTTTGDSETQHTNPSSSAGSVSWGRDPGTAVQAAPDIIGDTDMGDEPGPRSIADHYQDARDVYKALARVGDAETLAVADTQGWYRFEITDPEVVSGDGYGHVGKPVGLAEDLDHVLSQIGRTLYGTTSYKRPGAVSESAACRFVGGSADWAAEKPLPGYSDIMAVSAWGDVDLENGLRPQRGDLDARTRELIETVLQAYCDAFAELYGGHEHIYALDSVGGVYVFGAPAATVPIAEHFDGDEEALHTVMKAFVDRSNEWLSQREDAINARIDGAADLIDPDWCNNKNRKYKAPLSLHGDHDAVVTPFDTENVTYELTRFDDVTDDDVQAAKVWAAGLTDTAHRDESVTKTLVEHLWPEYYAEHGAWRAALDSFVEDAVTDDPAAGDTNNGDDSPEIDASGELTPRFDDVKTTIANLDIERVGEETIVHRWTDQARGYTDHSAAGNRAFIPIWGKDANGGNANFVTNDGTWVDSSKSHQAGPVEMALIAERDWTGAHRYQHASGEDWRRGVQYLRDKGFSIPVYVPDARTADGDEMPYWAVVKAARALGLVDEDDLVEREADDGSTYQVLPDAETYNAALELIEDAGLEHGRDHADTDTTPDSAAFMDVLPEYAPDDRSTYTDPDAQLAACVAAAADGAVPGDAELPTLALKRVVAEITMQDTEHVSLDDVSAGVLSMARDLFGEAVADPASAGDVLGVTVPGPGGDA